MSIEFIFEIIEQLEKLYNFLISFLFKEIEIPVIGTFSLWMLLGGAGLTLMLTIRIINLFRD